VSVVVLAMFVAYCEKGISGLLYPRVVLNNNDLRNLRMLKQWYAMKCVYPSFVIDHCFFLMSKVYNAKGH
jgi:hypothetical protein